MNLSDIRYPAQTRQNARNLLVAEARKTPKPAKRWKTPLIISVAGLTLAGTTAAGIYVALAPVDDKRDIRCYYRADLTTKYPVVAVPGATRPPYITAGIFAPGFDARNNPNPDDKNAGMAQVSDPLKMCTGLWDTGMMNPDGLTDDLIPAGCVPPVPAPPTWNGKDRDQNGNPITPGPNLHGPGHYIPPLAECVVENTVAVIPGPAQVCAHLGIPALEK
jgi:hypothetical protein